MKHEELFEKFIDGELKNEKLEKLKTSIDSNPEIAREIKLRREINDAVLERKAMLLRENLNRIHQQLQEEESQENQEKEGKVINLFSPARHWLAAASIILLMGIGGFLMFKSNQPGSPDQLYQKYYSSEEIVSAFRSGEEITSPLEKGLEQLRSANYSRALLHFENIQSENVKNFYLGITYMELENFDAAVENFDAVISSEPGIYDDQARWHKALATLKSDKHQEAIALFTEISSGNSKYASKAEEILQKLD